MPVFFNTTIHIPQPCLDTTQLLSSTSTAVHSSADPQKRAQAAHAQKLAHTMLVAMEVASEGATAGIQILHTPHTVASSARTRDLHEDTTTTSTC